MLRTYSIYFYLLIIIYILFVDLLFTLNYNAALIYFLFI